MADEPENLVLVQLREMRGELREMRGDVQAVRATQDEHANQLEKIAEAAYLGVGLATMANHKLDRLEERFEVFDRRLQAVE